MASSQMQYMLSDFPFNKTYFDEHGSELIKTDFVVSKHLLPWDYAIEDQCFLITAECPFDDKMKPRFVSCIKVDPTICKKMYRSLKECLEQSAHGEASDPIYINGRKDSTDHSEEMIIPPGAATILGEPMIGGMVAQ